MEFTREQIREACLKLPPELQDEIFNLNIAPMVKGWGNKYELHVDRTGTLADEIGLVLFGLVPSSEFVSRLKKLELGTEKTNSLATEINETIFKKIRSNLRAASETPVSALTPTKTEGIESVSKTESPIAKPETKLQSAFDKNKLLAEIENPSPASVEVKTVPPPVNLPIEPTVKTESSSALAETAIWRTMERDVAKHGGGASPSPETTPINRGKFGMGNAPTAMNNALRITNNAEEDQLKTGSEQSTKETAKPIAPVAPRPAEEKHYSPPVPPPTPSGTEEKRFEAPATPLSAPKSDNMLDNKLTKIVRIPSERKRYVVDPYREPTE